MKWGIAGIFALIAGCSMYAQSGNATMNKAIENIKKNHSMMINYEATQRQPYSYDKYFLTIKERLFPGASLEIRVEYIDFEKGNDILSVIVYNHNTEKRTRIFNEIRDGAPNRLDGVPDYARTHYLSDDGNISKDGAPDDMHKFMFRRVVEYLAK